MISLGNRIRKARENAGVTQEELAERIGVSRSAVARWELGEIEPKLKNLVALAVELEVSTDELLGISGQKAGGNLHRSSKEKLPGNQLKLSSASMEALIRFIAELKNES